MSADGNMIRREFPVELLSSGDGRTLDVRIIPYRTVSRVSDDGGRKFYDEQWEPGAFDKQLTAAHRLDVLANFEHQQGISGVVARGTELRDSDLALEGSFRMLNHPDADKALELVNEGVLTGVSIEAIPIKSTRENGVVRRVKARLVNIALCRSPAFADAQVLAIREQVPDDQELQENESGEAAGDDEPDPKTTEEGDKEPKEAPGAPDDQTIIEEPGVPDPPPPESKRSKSVADEMLQRVGYEQLAVQAFTKKPWNPAASRFTDEEYQRSCLIDRGGDAPVKERCSLPVMEPDGDINVNALVIAADALAGTRVGLAQVTPQMKSVVARKLLRYCRQANLPTSQSLHSLAAR